MELSETIRGRRSIRRFKNQSVPKEVLQKILDLALWAPSGMNRQEWYFLAVQGEKKNELLRNHLSLADSVYRCLDFFPSSTISAWNS